MIELRHVKKSFDGSVTLKDVCGEVRDGEVISIIGPSGTGKSTLLRCINRLETPDSGQILVGGQDVTAPDCNIRALRQKVGMVFQSFNLFGHLTAIENIIAAPMDLKKISKEEAWHEGMHLLRAVGLYDKAYSYPDELSGGQKQRVAIARTLAMDPSVILMDEPTSALDPAMVGEVQAVIRELAKSGKTMLIVTHEMAFARAICSRVFYMDEGVIYEEGTPEEIFDAPKREKTRQFVQHLKVLELTVDSRNYDFLGRMTAIAEYAAKNRLPHELTEKIQLVFEELVHHILLPRMDRPDILFTAEYAEDDGSVLIRVLYGTEAFDPLSGDGDGLSAAVLRGVARDIRYEAAGDGTRVNRITLRL